MLGASFGSVDGLDIGTNEFIELGLCYEKVIGTTLGYFYRIKLGT